MQVNPDDIPAEFPTIPDPRKNRRKKHDLSEVICVSVLAVICGADNAIALGDKCMHIAICMHLSYYDDNQDTGDV